MEKLKSDVLAKPGLVGREIELNKLHLLLDFALEGHGKTVLLSGEAGTGKTRLVGEFLNSVIQRNGIIVLTGWSLSDAGVPFFPFKIAIRGYFSGSNSEGQLSSAQQSGKIKSELSPLKVWLANPEKYANLSPQAWRDMTFTIVNAALISLSAEKPIVLFVDDLQWADSASIALLHYISKTTRSNRVLIIAAYRDEELNPDYEGHPHPLCDSIRMMRREDLFEEIKLQGLQPKDTIVLAENMVKGRLQSDFAQKLLHDSQGNPLYIIESMRMLVEKEQIAKENNKWVLSTDRIKIPTKIKDIVLHRAEMLNSNQRRMLDVASAIGEEFDPKLLAATTKFDLHEVLETLESISSTSSLIIGKGSSFKFDHANTRASIYEALSSPVREEYHARIAEKLESDSKEKLPVYDLAYHYSQSGKIEKAIHFSSLAGNEALQQCSGAEAIQHFEFVLNNIGKDTPSELRDMSFEGLGESFYLIGNLKQAKKTFEDLSNSTVSPLTKLRCLRKAMFVDHFQLANTSYTLDLARKAMETADAIKGDSEIERLECARTRLNKGLLERSRGKRKEALEDFDKAIEVFEEECSLPDLVDALPQFAWALADDGQLEYALAAALRACSLSEQSVSLAQKDQALLILSLIFTFCGLRSEALQINRDEQTIGEKISDPASRWWNRAMSHNVSGLLLEFEAADKISAHLPIESMRDFGTRTKMKFFVSTFFSGALSSYKQDLKAAVIQSLKGVEAAEETDSNDVLSLNYANLLREYSLLGDLSRAEKYHNKLAKIIETTGIADYVMIKSIQSLSEGVFFSSRRQWKEANRSFEEALDANSRIGPRNFSEAGARLNYAITLLQQGMFADAKVQFGEAKRILDNLEKRFARTNLIASLTLPLNIEIGQELTVRMDIINVGKNRATLSFVEGLFPPEFEVSANQPALNLKNGSIDLGKKRIDSFRDEAFSFRVRATVAGTFNLNPKLFYLNESGQLENGNVRPARIIVQPSAAKSSEPGVTEDHSQIGIEFETESAQKTFDFLANSFILDYMRRRLPLEWSGWRTLMEIANSAKVSQRSLYGENNYRGRAITELEKRGLIEARVFPKERGRGGKIFKVRVSYDRDVVKRLVDQKVFLTGKNEISKKAA